MRSNFQSLMSSRNHPCVHRPLFLFVKLLPMLLDNTDRIILYPTAPIKKKKKNLQSCIKHKQNVIISSVEN